MKEPQIMFRVFIQAENGGRNRRGAVMWGIMDFLLQFCGDAVYAVVVSTYP